MAIFDHNYRSLCCVVDIFMKSPREIEDLLFDVYPQTKNRFSILKAEGDALEICLKVDRDDLRPGSTISGPSMFTLADCAMYSLILGVYEEQVQAVTTNVSINFFRRPTLNNLIAHARLLKKGRRLVVGDVLIKSNDIDVAHASLTYALD